MLGKNPNSSVQIVEVGPRDGLQNIQKYVVTEDKIAFIQKLVNAGCTRIEVTSFVHPKTVPQLKDAEAVCAALPVKENVRYSALVMNERGLDRALAADVKEIAVVAAASETFSQKNIGKSIDDSLAEFRKIADRALAHHVKVRGYVSTAWWCPYENKEQVDPQKVIDITNQLFDLGVYEVSLADTIGKAKPVEVSELLWYVLSAHDPRTIALHMHDTGRNALANIECGYAHGIRTFDSSIGGLGGCPFSNVSVGNVATEDVVDFFEKKNIKTGIDLKLLLDAAQFIEHVTGTS